MRLLVLIITLCPLLSFAQPINIKGDYGGVFSLGVRTTASAFNSHHDESTGLGVGGQFRIRFADRVNSDWFFDYIQSDLGDYAHRTDYHIGWSVLYYLRKDPNPLIQPYVLAGHCFDYTLMTANNDRNNFEERWSSAVQGGLGMHLNLSPRMDLSLVTQYMMHLGNEVTAGHAHDGVVEFHNETGGSMEGHLLFHVGINYKIGDLW